MAIYSQNRIVKAVFATALAVGTCGLAQAERFDDGLYKPYEQAVKGKRVVFVPMSMSIDITRAWYEGMKKNAAAKGYTVDVRDPNWRVDVAVQAADQAINEKPDVLVLHADDLMAFNRTIKKARSQGIRVVQLNIKSMENGDAFIGPDWYEVGQRQAKAAVEFCGTGSGRSGQVAIIHGQSVSNANRTILPGIEDELAKHKEIKVVARQSGDYDSNKARGVAATILKQNPNICAFIGLWESMDIGVANAVRQAGLTNKVAVITEGGGNQESGCNQIASGNFTYYVNWNARAQVATLVNTVDLMLQTKAAPGNASAALYSPLETLTKKNVKPTTCWAPDELAKSAN